MKVNDIIKSPFKQVATPKCDPPSGSKTNGEPGVKGRTSSSNAVPELTYDKNLIGKQDKSYIK